MHQWFFLPFLPLYLLPILFILLLKKHKPASDNTKKHCCYHNNNKTASVHFFLFVRNIFGGKNGVGGNKSGMYGLHYSHLYTFRVVYYYSVFRAVVWWCGILVTFLCAVVHVHYVLVRFPALFLCISTGERVRERKEHWIEQVGNQRLLGNGLSVVWCDRWWWWRW